MQDVHQEPIAIVGMGCRFPRANNPQDFWALLREGKDAIQEVPADRWDSEKVYDPDSTLPGKTVSRWGGFLDQIDQFDWRAFRMLPREATSMDPQQRLLLEVAWEALEDAGLPFEEVAGSQTSVSIGLGFNDYLHLQMRNWSQMDEYTAIGNANSFAANRLSYMFDLKGPSVSVETGCTSSLTAVYLACQSLWSGEARLALAGGVSLILSPESMIMLSKAGLLSKVGRCKTLDADADGFVRGEGAGLIVLKPLSQVTRSDRVYALIRGIAANHNGHNEWIIASSQRAQEALLRDAYRKAGVNPAFVDYVELNGTGFQRGDTIEAKALGAVLGNAPERTYSCFVGSVKTNIGHLDAASGIASVIKVALSLSHGCIPPTLNLQTLNPDIPLDDLHLATPQTNIPWPGNVEEAIAGVTTLAFNGTNAHVVLTAHSGMENVGKQTSSFPHRHENDDESTYRLLPLSAKTKQALYGQAEAYRNFLLTNTVYSWRDICYSASTRRTHHSHRIAVLGHTPQEAANALNTYLQKQNVESDSRDDLQQELPPRLATLKALYTAGNEVDWSELYQEEECHCVSLPPYAWQRERLWPDWLDVEQIGTPPEEGSTTPHRRDSARLLSSPKKIEIDGREVTEVLTELWADVLGLETVNPSESFFELGGHSLLAMTLLARIRDVFQVELALTDLLAAPKPFTCAERIRQAPTKKVSQTNFESVASSQPAIIPDLKHRHEPFPTTDIQQAYWVGRYAAFHIGNVGNHGYIEVEATDLDLERFNRALQRLIERHDMLRAVLLPDGQQQILEQVPPFEIKIADLRGQDPQAQADNLAQIRQRLDHQILPTEQWPAFELWIARINEQHVRLHLSIESIFVDAWSMNTLIHEFVRLYHEPDLSLPKPSLSFRDYVLAEASLHTSEQYQRSREYWLARLSSLPPAPDLPLISESESAFQQPHFVHRESKLAREHWQQLKEHAAKIGVTPSGILLTAFAEVIAAWSKSARFSLNLSTFNRLPLHPEVNDIGGDFTSLLVLAVDHTTPASFEMHAKRIQEQLWNDLDHSSYSGIAVLRELIKIQGEGIKAIMPIVFTSLLIQDTASPLPLPWGKTVYCVSQTPQVWLDHQVLETGGNLVFHWQSVDAIFPAGLIESMFSTYCQLLQRLATGELNWQEPVRHLLPEQQRTLVVQANTTEGPVSEKLLHTLCYEQITQRPDQLALISPICSLRYKQVYSGAVQLAHQLRGWGVRPNHLIAVVMEKGWEQVVAVLGILQSGAAYLPIDANLPGERLRYLLEDGRVAVALTQSWIDERAEWPNEVKRICVDRLNLDDVDLPWLDSVQGPDDLAYVMYTSGSTGVPKGVMIDHRGAVNTIRDINQRFNVNSSDKVFALSALNFDLSVYDIFGILAAGGTIVMPPEGSLRDPAIWIDLLVQEQITIWNTVPALLQMLVDYTDHAPETLKHTSLRLALLSGDWIPLSLPERVKERIPDLQVISLGGATEASIWSILYPINTIDHSWKSIPYGKPMYNQRFFVLNDMLDSCPVWVPGHLYIAGVGLAKGYWRDEKKTQASFFHHPLTNERLYRTGDLGRYLPDGNIEFLGREDFQIKVQGHRIELGEIEETLLRHPAVHTAVVTAITEPHGDKRLAPTTTQLMAYVILQSDQKISANGNHTSSYKVDETTTKSYTLEKLTGQSPLSAERNGSHPHIHDEGKNQYETLQRLAAGFGQASIRKDVNKPIEIVPEANPELASVVNLTHVTDNPDMLRKYRERLSYRSFLQETIPFKQFSAFLNTLGQIELEGLPKYRYPSAGGIYPVQTYLSVKAQRVEEIPEGIYYFNPQSSQLVMLSSSAHLNRNIHGTINQPIFDESAFSLFFIGDLTTISSLYGYAARDFCLLEAGYMSQLLMMTGAESHIGLCPIGGLDFEQIRDTLVLEESHVLLHTLLCGRVDPRIATGWSFLLENTEKVAPLLPTQPAPTSGVTTTALRSFLKEKLPEYMIPSAIMVLDSLPLTPNGKVDRKHLPKPEIQSSRKETVYRAPTSETEQKIAAVWQEVLPTKKVGVHDTFFDLGGNSLLMVQAYTKLCKVLGNKRDLSIIEMFFQYPTIHALAEFLTPEPGQEGQSPLEDTPEEQHRVERRNASLQQERLTRLRHRRVEASPIPTERNQEDA